MRIKNNIIVPKKCHVCGKDVSGVYGKMQNGKPIHVCVDCKKDGDGFKYKPHYVERVHFNII